MKRRRRPFRLFAAASVAAVAALLALTVFAVRMNDARSEALADVAFQEDVREALWRMEFRAAAILATTREGIPTASSAQLRGVFAACAVDPADNAIVPHCDDGPSIEVMACAMLAADDAFEEGTLADSFDGTAVRECAPERQQRAWVSGISSRAGTQSESIGPLAPYWTSDDKCSTLLLTRRVERQSAVAYESFSVAWDALQDTLLAEIDDLLPGSRVTPIREADAPVVGAQDLRLAAIPVRLEARRPAYALTVSRAHLWPIGGAWLGLVIALICGVVALRSSMAYGDKHRRFTHAVTHELRTPLTTFRMYSEMLRDGVVPPESQPEYLKTLECESRRLSSLVDNVLRYARLEEGAPVGQRTRTTIDDMVKSLTPALGAPCGARGVALAVNVSPGVRDSVLSTDPDAVTVILSGLVDNALKYGCRGDAKEVALEVAMCGGRVHFDIVDAGAGVAPLHAERIFEPFDRAGRDSSDTAPGVGLGLALGRDLAGELGGELVLAQAQLGSERESGEGARFSLRLPLKA